VADFPVDVECSSYAGPETGRRELSFYSIRELASLFRRRRRFLLGTIGGLLLLCLIYCLIAPNQFEASARVGLRMQPTSSLTVDAAETIAPASILSTPLQLETLANVLHSEQLSWRVIRSLKLYESAAFTRDFGRRFPGFDPEKPTPEAQGYLLEAFAKRLRVRTLPRTLLLEIRYRSKDPTQAAQVVNALIEGFRAQEGESRVDATEEASRWLQGQLKTLTAQVEGKERRLAEFERRNGFMARVETAPGGETVDALHGSTVKELDEAERMLAAATGDRILREALYVQAQKGNPEQVLAANPEVQAEMGPGGAALEEQLRTRLSEVNVELAQLKAEHGANFPRVVELTRAGQEIEEQIRAEDENLVQAFERSWRAAGAREQLLRKEVDARTEEGLRENDATIEYSVLHDEVMSGRELCTRLTRRIEEAELSAGVRGSSITVVDYARVPYKPVSPDMALYLAITLFSSVWLALGGALLLDALRPVVEPVRGAAVCLIFLVVGAASASGQAPIPNTQGLPSGVVKLPEEQPLGLRPDAKDSPPVWNSVAPASAQGTPELAAHSAGTSMPLPIAAGDFLDVSEFHTPEFRSAVRVAADGTVLLPLAGSVKLAGMTEQQASGAVEKALVEGRMLLHPQVSVLVTNAVGQDVSVMGEVARPGVYAYTSHHRLLDLIAAASGLSANAGRLVSVFHRDDPHTGHPVVLDPTGAGSIGTDAKSDHNPELAPGDTVLVSRAGLVYVIGDVIRPGGFAVDPVQGLTVVQALSLAWGATPNAAGTKAILIRDQAGGRTLTTLNLRRMIRGQDPDQPVKDRDILFVPDSTAKNLMNKSLESAIQSAIGVSIYAGLVYSQRF
jgi:uncharacterized protein involved in exopolysaccharide biosynthesis/protein involved in polysaccharide export with SLBB domain